jgi:hypothetical protein
VLYAMRWTKLDLTCIFFKIKLSHHSFKSSLLICSSWIDQVNFLHSLFRPRCCLFSDRHCHATASCLRFLPIKPTSAWYHLFIFRQHFISLPPLSSRNRSIESASSPPATLPGPPDSQLQCYKKVTLSLSTLPTTQSRLHFTSFLARALRH